MIRKCASKQRLDDLLTGRPEEVALTLSRLIGVTPCGGACASLKQGCSLLFPRLRWWCPCSHSGLTTVFTQRLWQCVRLPYSCCVPPGRVVSHTCPLSACCGVQGLTLWSGHRLCDQNRWILLNLIGKNPSWLEYEMKTYSRVADIRTPWSFPCNISVCYSSGVTYHVTHFLHRAG